MGKGNQRNQSSLLPPVEPVQYSAPRASSSGGSAFTISSDNSLVGPAAIVAIVLIIAAVGYLAYKRMTISANGGGAKGSSGKKSSLDLATIAKLAAMV